MKNKFVNIDIEGEGNIAVLDLGIIDGDNQDRLIKERVEEKLVKALEEHFDVPVKIRLTEVLSSLGYIRVRSTVIVEAEEEDRTETVDLEETWVY